MVMDPAKRPTAKELLMSPAFAAQGLYVPEDAQKVIRNIQCMAPDCSTTHTILTLAEN